MPQKSQNNKKFSIKTHLLYVANPFAVFLTHKFSQFIG